MPMVVVVTREAGGIKRPVVPGPAGTPVWYNSAFYESERTGCPGRACPLKTRHTNRSDKGDRVLSGQAAGGCERAHRSADRKTGRGCGGASGAGGSDGTEASWPRETVGDEGCGGAR